MGRPFDWTPIAEGDPVPGDPEEVRRLAQRCQDMADAIRAAGTSLRKVQAEGTSLALTEFREMTGETAAKIEQVEPRYQALADNMFGWADDLVDLQFPADSALAKAKILEDERLRQQGRLAFVPVGADPLAQQSALDTATQAVEAQRIIVEKIRDEYQRKGHARSVAVDRVIDHDDVKDGFWDNVAGVVAAIADVAGKLAAALGVAALVVGFIPIIGAPLAGILATASLALSAVVLIANLGLLLSGSSKGSLSDLLWAGFGVATFGVGRAFATFAKSSAVASRAMVRVGTVRKFKKVDGLSPTVAANRMSAVLGSVDGAGTSALQGVPRRIPKVGDILRGGYGNLLGGVASNAAAVRTGAQGGWAPIRAGFGGYFDGGGVATLSRMAGMHDNAAELAKLNSTREALAGAGHALRPGDALKVEGLARQGLGQVVTSGSSTLSGGGRDVQELAQWVTGRG